MSKPAGIVKGLGVTADSHLEVEVVGSPVTTLYAVHPTSGAKIPVLVDADGKIVIAEVGGSVSLHGLSTDGSNEDWRSTSEVHTRAASEASRDGSVAGVRLGHQVLWSR